MSQRKALALAACLFFSAILSIASPASAQAPANAPDRLQWFREAKFGLFIHWGAYAMTGREEWARQLLQIPREEYRTMALGFDPVAFDPDEWAGLARDAGVEVRRHHLQAPRRFRHLRQRLSPISTSWPPSTGRTSSGRWRPR
ncbi:MAG: alpha-L-fucosidase [Ignavibacteriales bacterium]|nr:alpha-L-fucosidase [Ignavibacteriales bacterium]